MIQYAISGTFPAYVPSPPPSESLMSRMPRVPDPVTGARRPSREQPNAKSGPVPGDRAAHSAVPGRAGPTG
ncbi:hypothetical protein GCM10017786_34070 [Amycolatopsis deserti]|uniref:Uncharacterized protein n=1 Tax=Amycolatopsis deserti TaxID=185696 RepID=A0ABQ3J478_9PSEU|nr:hypothetical protein GCM10017786_34070 [Amycolatopsis deserti]